MTTDLKPGDLVQHPEHGYGVVLKNVPGVPTIYFADKHGYENTTRRFTGWERVETVRPGHVQVRVDDLDDCPSEWLREDEDTWNFAPRVAIRVAKAIDAQRAQNTPPADAYDTAADYLDAVNDNREHDPTIRDLRSQAQCLREDAARAHLRRP